jgi:hypothetical protein
MVLLDLRTRSRWRSWLMIYIRRSSRKHKIEATPQSPRGSLPTISSAGSTSCSTRSISYCFVGLITAWPQIWLTEFLSSSALLIRKSNLN